MDKKTFTHMLDTYGSDLSRWPINEKSRSELLMQKDFMAQLEQEQTFDEFLQNHEVEPRSDFLEQLTSDLHAKIDSEFSNLWAPLPPKLAALSFALVLGFLVSFLDLGQLTDTIYFDEIALNLNQQGEQE